jgi:dihydrofolate reductase
VTIVADPAESAIAGIRSKPGKDIWLFGGGSLFHSLLEARVVGAVEVAAIPVLLGGGIPLLPPAARRAKLRLVGSKTFTTGIVSLGYAIENESAGETPGASRE